MRTTTHPACDPSSIPPGVNALSFELCKAWATSMPSFSPRGAPNLSAVLPITYRLLSAKQINLLFHNVELVTRKTPPSPARTEQKTLHGVALLIASPRAPVRPNESKAHVEAVPEEGGAIHHLSRYAITHSSPGGEY